MLQLLSPSELANLLGMATQTIYNRINIGASLPPRVRFGRLIRFPMPGIETWILAQAENSTPSIFEDKPLHEQHRRGRPTKAEQIAKRKK